MKQDHKFQEADNNGKYTFAFIFFTTLIVAMWSFMFYYGLKDLESNKQAQIENTNQ